MSWPFFVGAAHAQSKAGELKLAPAQPARPKPERYEIDVEFQPERAFLRAKATVTLRATEPTRAIEFELNPRLHISEITDEAGRKLEFTRSGRMGSPKLLVTLAGAAAAGATLVLRFTYEGILPPGPLDYITKDGILLRDESRWYPATDLSAFSLNRAAIKLPSKWVSLFAGHSFTTPRASSSRALVAMPAPWWGGRPWPCSICAQYLPRERWEMMSCASHCRLRASVMIETSVIQTSYDFMVFNHELLGADPFGYTFNVGKGFPGQRGAIGYSGTGFLVVSEDVLEHYGHPGYAPEFLPHEIAHQWFPIEVTLKSEEDGWLAESVAEYLAWRYLQEKQPEDARRMVARAMRNALEDQPVRPLRLGLKLFALEEWDVTRRVLYERGMLVWRTLETVIGRQRVDAALREYYKRHRGGPAAIADFRKICEEISGRELGWFFDYYIDGTELPEIEIRRTPAGPNEYAGEIVIRNAPPEFQARVEMRLLTAKGATVEHSVATSGPVTPFALNTPDAVSRITLDPDARILRVTGAAQRHAAQQPLLARLGELERAGSFAEALALCEQALAADPEDLAANHQQIRLEMGRLYHRQGKLAEAWQSFERALALDSLDVMAADFYRAWSRVYRARIARAQGRPAAARAEAQVGLASKSPALETSIRWPGDARAATALQALRREATLAAPKKR